MFAFCKFKGIGIISYSPLMAGYLARPLGTETLRSNHMSGSPFEKKRRDSDDEIIKRVQVLAGRYSVKMSQVAVAWSILKVSSTIVGANTVRL
jgi:aryl-alcohol dehydrogenase-like predicted oxidoreductase